VSKRKANSMSDTLADLMLKNLSDVFGERDSERRMAAIKNLYSEDAVFFEGEQRFEGRQALRPSSTGWTSRSSKMAASTRFTSS
jgi:ketosteroid isomerase-like protein